MAACLRLTKISSELYSYVCLALSQAVLLPEEN